MTNQHTLRSPKTGRFICSNAATNIVNGRLYQYMGTVVRARKLTNNGLRLVSFHKTLNGFVRDSDLMKIDNKKIREYLDQA